MKKYIMLVIIALSSFEIYPQETLKNDCFRDSIITYDVCDASLSELIDSFINQEKDYQYFDDSCSFYLLIGHLNDSCLWLCLSSGFPGYITETQRLIRQELIERKEYLIRHSTHYIIVENPNINLLDGMVNPSDQKYYVDKNKIEINTDFYKDGDWVVPNSWVVFYSQGDFIVVEKEDGTMPKVKVHDANN